MNVDDALYHLVHEYPGGSESLAPRVGMSAAVMRNKVNPNCATHLPSVRDLRTWMAMADDLRPLHALAAEFGQVMLKPADGDAPGDMAVLEVISSLWVRNGDLGAAVHSALCDGALTQAEMTQIRGAVYRLQQQLGTLLQRLDGMSEPAYRADVAHG